MNKLSDISERKEIKIMDYPLTLYYNTEISNVQTLDLCRGDNDYRKVYIADDGNKKIVIKHLSNTFSDKQKIEGWFHLMNEYRKSGLYCPSIIPNINGELLHKHTLNDRDYYVYAEEFALYQTAEDLGKDKYKTDVNGQWPHIPDVLRSLGMIASKRFDFLDFPSVYCLLEPFSSDETTDEVTECALLFVDYIKEKLPQYLPRAEKLLDLFYRNQEECRKIYNLLPESCFQADLNRSNILLDDNLKFVGLIDFNLCGKEKILNYAIHEAFFATYQKCLVNENNNYIFYFDKELDDIRMKTFLRNMSYIQETYTFNEDEKRAFPILLRYINTFWWYSLEDLKFFSSDKEKVEQILDWFEYQMTRDDLRLA